MTPSLKNVIVLLWLTLTFKDFLRHVQQGCWTKLRLKTVASIQPEIFQDLESLSDELRFAEDSCIKGLAHFYAISKRPGT